MRRGVTILLTIAFLVAACGSPSPSPSPTPGVTVVPVSSRSPSPSQTPLPSLSATVPAEGTTLAVPGGASVRIPAGAVPEGTTASISAGQPSGGPTDAWPADAVGPTWSIDAGGAALARPVTLTLPFDTGALPSGTDPAGLLLAYRNPATGAWMPVPATVDGTAGTVTATVDHLSVWSLFTIDWDYWVTFIKQAASGNLGDLLNGVVTITGRCATTSSVFTVDNGATNGMVKGCIESSTKTSAKVRVTNLRAFRLKLFGDALDAANGSLLASGESVTLSVGGTKQIQPVVVAADLDALGLGYDITDIVLRLLPGSDLVKDAGTYGKVLDEVVTATATLWTSAQILDDLKAGKVVSAASATVELLTSETYLTTLLAALHAAGKAHGIPILAALSKDGIRRVLAVVNLTDLIVTTFTFVVQYIITAHSEVRVSWLTPPTAPTAPGQGGTGRVYQGVFTPTGSMSVARDSPSATLLPDGRVLVVDGWDGNRSLASAELYDPRSGSFSPTGSMSVARLFPSATLLPDSRVLLAGGSEFNGPLASAELYNPRSGTFSPTGSMSVARGFPAATLLLDGRVLVVGGVNDNGSLASAELYDPQTGSFSPTGSMSVARDSPPATLLPDGRVLVVGGSLDASAELYDPQTGTFSPTGSMSVARSFPDSFPAVTLLSDGRVLVAGGRNDNGSLASAELYDPRTGSFSPTGSMSVARDSPSATLLPDGRVLVVGGLGEGITALANAELYDPRTGTFSPTGSMSVAREGPSATLLPDGRVLVVGGRDAGGTPLASAELFR